MKETGGPNVQCFRRKTALKTTLSWAGRSYLQQALTINTPAGLGAILLPKLCRALCRNPKLEQLPRPGR